MERLNESFADRVEDTVYAWANVTTPVKKSTPLEDIWGEQAATTPFPNPATLELIDLLTKEFQSGTDARELSGLTPSVFGPGGAITTLDDLSKWIWNAPVAQHAYIAGFADARGGLNAHAQFVDAIPSEVVKRLAASSSTQDNPTTSRTAPITGKTPEPPKTPARKVARKKRQA